MNSPALVICPFCEHPTCHKCGACSCAPCVCGSVEALFVASKPVARKGDCRICGEHLSRPQVKAGIREHSACALEVEELGAELEVAHV